MNGIMVVKPQYKQYGFLALTLVIIMLFVGTLGAGIAYMYSRSGRAVGHGAQSDQALSLAEAAVSAGSAAFKANPVYPCPTNVTLANPSCTLSAWSIPQTLGRGQFQYKISLYTGPSWSLSYTPAAPSTKTSATIYSSKTSQIIPVNSIANLAPTGQVVIMNGATPNYVNYTGVSASSSVCGYGITACLTGAVYNGSATLSSGAKVTQNQTVLLAAVKPSSSLQSIRIANATNLAPLGGVIIGGQSINYAGISNNSTVCGGTGPCLVGASYPTGSVLPINSRVSQNQIIVSGQGGVPSLTKPEGERTAISPLYVTTTTVTTDMDGSRCSEGTSGSTTTTTTDITVGGWTELVN